MENLYLPLNFALSLKCSKTYCLPKICDLKGKIPVISNTLLGKLLTVSIYLNKVSILLNLPVLKFPSIFINCEPSN